MTKYLISISVVIIAGILIYYFYFREPKFYIKSFDSVSYNGVFVFAGKENMFDKSKSGSISHNEYSLVYGFKEGKYKFDLYKNGSFIKNVYSI